jgi:hypothetical protein
MKPGIKHHKPCRQAASICLNAAHKHAFYAVRPEMIDQDYWRKIAMLDENTVGYDQTVVFWMPITIWFGTSKLG